MIIALQIIFLSSILAIVHSYLIFPAFIKILAKKRVPNNQILNITDNLPSISIVMSVFNEDVIIKEKIESIFNTNYPLSKLELLVGSDASTDNTNKYINELTSTYPLLYFTPFTDRQGKPNVVNQLVDNATGEILILTDANVMFEEDTIFNMIKHYKNKQIGLVDTNMINKGVKVEGISVQEKAYINREVYIKNHESIIWGSMMGPFGGCFSIRKELFEKVPSNYLVDDFFISMKVLEKGFKTINDLDAKVYEDVSNNLKDEFRRKVRIATGNFQNLQTFRKLLWPPFKGSSFCFLSHKVLRWLGPFFLLASFISNLFLIDYNELFLVLFYGQILFFLSPIFDNGLKKLNLHNKILRFFNHFISMNLALFIGFFKYLKGVKTNVWQPTKRFQ